jgi:hypothetical protein
MNKKMILIFVSLIVTVSSIAQVMPSISPDGATEFCPNVNTTFTVTLPRIKDGTIPSVVSWVNGPIVVNGASNIINTSTKTTLGEEVGKKAPNAPFSGHFLSQIVGQGE